MKVHTVGRCGRCDVVVAEGYMLEAVIEGEMSARCDVAVFLQTVFCATAAQHNYASYFA